MPIDDLSIERPAPVPVQMLSYGMPAHDLSAVVKTLAWGALLLGTLELIIGACGILNMFGPWPTSFIASVLNLVLAPPRAICGLVVAIGAITALRRSRWARGCMMWGCAILALVNTASMVEPVLELRAMGLFEAAVVRIYLSWTVSNFIQALFPAFIWVMLKLPNVRNAMKSH